MISDGDLLAPCPGGTSCGSAVRPRSARRRSPSRPGWRSKPPPQQATPTRNISGTELKILQWSHFVPRYDTWFDAFAKAWGDANGVSVTVDHINTAEVPAAIAAEISAGEGHDLSSTSSPPPNTSPSMLDLTDVVTEASNRHGEQLDMCMKNSFNPTTNTYFAFVHGYAPDPANYRKSLWEGGRPAERPDDLRRTARRRQADQGRARASRWASGCRTRSTPTWPRRR